MERRKEVGFIDRHEATSRAKVVAALLCAGGATVLAWAASSNSPQLNVPPAIAYVAAAVLGLGALRLLQLVRRPTSSGDRFAALITGGMAAIGGWIAFGPGARACTTGSDGVVSTVAGSSCRIPFGIGAVITLSISVYATRRWLRHRRLARREQHRRVI